MSYPTLTGRAVEGVPFREPRMSLGPTFANSTYKFFLSGTTTPALVYRDSALTNAFLTGVVTSDAFGNFPPIYLDTSVTYKVQFFDSTNTLRWTAPSYTAPLATVGNSAASFLYGFQIAASGTVTVDGSDGGGGTGIALTLKAGALGTAALKLVGSLPGNSALTVNNSATTGAQTATFTATNKPGTATSSPAGWLPLTCDGVQYYTPVWHGNPFTPYASSPSAQGEVIVASSVTFTGSGLTTAVGGTATPPNWFVPAAAGIGAGYYINITKGGILSGLAFTVAANIFATVAPSGAAYVGGTLTANFTGNTASNYKLLLSTGQVISGCTFTNGSATFTCPSTSITGTPLTVLSVTTQGVWANITANGLTISSNAQATITGTYQISSSSSGTPVVASGTLTFSNNSGVQQPTINGAANLILAGNGTATLNGVSTTNWYTPTTANIGNGFYILITQFGGTAGATFSAGTGSYTAITGAGLTIGIAGGTSPKSVSGYYNIASDPAGVNQLASGNITLTG